MMRKAVRFLAGLAVLCCVVQQFASAATYTLNSGDTLGNTSFNAAGQWSSSAAPAAGNNYFDAYYNLRTPPGSASYSFAGDLLTLQDGGRVINKGTAAGQTITFSGSNGGLTLNAGGIFNGNNVSWTLAGTVFLTSNGGIISDQQAGSNMTVSANITSGTAASALSLGGCVNTTLSPIILSGSNSYTGPTNLLGGTVQLANAAALSASTSLQFGSACNTNGVLGTTAGTLDLNGYNPTVTGLSTVNYVSATGSATGTAPSTGLAYYTFTTLPAGIQVGQEVSAGSGTSDVAAIDTTTKVAVHFLKLALHDCEELIMKEIWTLSNSRKMFSGV